MQNTKEKTKLQETHKYKPLRRNITIRPQEQSFLRVIRMKKVYIRKVSQKGPPYRELILKGLTKNLFKDSRIFKYLIEFNMEPSRQLYWLEGLKKAKKLQRFSFNMRDLPPVKHWSYFTRYLERLPKSLQNIQIEILQKNEKEFDRNIRKVYRSLACLSNLKTITIGIGNKQVSKEMKLIKRYISRSAKLEEFKYLNNEDNKEMHKCFSYKDVYPWITTLQVPLADLCYQDKKRNSLFIYDIEECFENQQKFKEKSPQSNDEEENVCQSLNENSENDSETKEQSNLESEVIVQKPYFSFKIFPNLRYLVLTSSKVYWKSSWSLNKLLAKEFSLLTNLQGLKLDISYRPLETIFLFIALLHLPLLSHFWIQILFLENEEWNLLFEFLKKQLKIQTITIYLIRDAMSLAIPSQKNLYIEKLHECFENKPDLTDISIRSTYIPISSISKCLERTIMTNQLRSLELNAIEFNKSSPDEWEQVKGLCEFIRRQKESLRYVKLKFHWIKNQILLNYILDEISELKTIKELSLGLNFIKMSKRNQTTFNINIASMLQNLNTLESFSFCFPSGDRKEFDLSSWFESMIFSLSNLKSLRNLCLDLWECRNLNFSSKLLINKNIKRVKIIACGYDLRLNLEKQMDKMNEVQSFRCDLMF